MSISRVTSLAVYKEALIPGQTSMPNLTLPGYKYLGPGNPLYAGEPTDEADRIARVHDWEYHYSTSDDQVRQADREAIARFTSDAVLHRSVSSAIGALGLGLKYTGESIFGVQYGRNTTGQFESPPDDLAPVLRKKGYMASAPKRPAEQPIPLDDPTKKTKTDTQSPSAPMDTTETGTTGKSATSSSSAGPAGASSGIGANPERAAPNTGFQTGRRVIKHKHLIETIDFGMVDFKTEAKTKDGMELHFTTTPLCHIPCDVLPFYMSRAEFDELPPSSSVKVCKVVLKPIGFRTPFVANSAQLAAVNSMLLVQGAYAYGLRNKYGGQNCKLSAEATAPQVPTKCDYTDVDFDPQIFWSKPGERGFPTSFLYTRQLYHYYCQHWEKRQSTSILPTIMDDLHLFNLPPGGSSERVEWEYRPQVNICKGADVYPPFVNYAQTNNTFQVLSGTKGIGVTAKILEIPDNDKINIKSDIITFDMSRGSTTNPYTQYIEHAGIAFHGFNEYGGALIPPSLHVGILPVQTSPVGDVDQTQLAYAMWELETYIEIEYSMELIYPFNSFMNPIQTTFLQPNLFDYTKRSFNLIVNSQRADIITTTAAAKFQKGKHLRHTRDVGEENVFEEEEPSQGSSKHMDISPPTPSLPKILFRKNK